jgi:RecJ-like exonuclease
LTAANVGQIVAVRGKVVETSSFSAGFKFLIDDGTGRMSLTLFDSNYKFVPNRSGLNLGAEVSIEAEVAQFNGVLELQPNSGRDVVILTPGNSASVPLTTINQLLKPGQFVAIEGKITEVRPFSSGLNLSVDDGTGNVRVTVFNNVLAYVPDRDGLIAGADVRVVGKTDFFGRMQVVPALGYDVSLK